MNPLGNNQTTVTSESSSTSGSTKMYISGGIKPNSPIIINRPRPNYFGIGVIIVISGLILYNLKK